MHMARVPTGKIHFQPRGRGLHQSGPDAQSASLGRVDGGREGRWASPGTVPWGVPMRGLAAGGRGRPAGGAARGRACVALALGEDSLGEVAAGGREGRWASPGTVPWGVPVRGVAAGGRGRPAGDSARGRAWVALALGAGSLSEVAAGGGGPLVGAAGGAAPADMWAMTP